MRRAIIPSSSGIAKIIYTIIVDDAYIGARNDEQTGKPFASVDLFYPKEDLEEVVAIATESVRTGNLPDVGTCIGFVSDEEHLLALIRFRADEVFIRNTIPIDDLLPFLEILQKGADIILSGEAIFDPMKLAEFSRLFDEQCFFKLRIVESEENEKIKVWWETELRRFRSPFGHSK